MIETSQIGTERPTSAVQRFRLISGAFQTSRSPPGVPGQSYPRPTGVSITMLPQLQSCSPLPARRKASLFTIWQMRCPPAQGPGR